MKVLQHTETLQPQHDVRHLALGFFDGLHRGHRSVIVNGYTREQLELTCVVTFWPHPFEVLNPTHKPGLITNLEEKIRILQKWKLGFVYVVPFTTQLARLPYMDFLNGLHQVFPSLQTVSVGPNFRFGKDRIGNPLTLAEWCQNYKITFHLADFVLDDSDPISSTRIRALLESGELSQANHLLGHSHSIVGRVKTGNQLGRKLGYPTANLQLSGPLLVPHGVYKTLVQLEDGSSVSGALNYGRRPTLDGGSVEEHVEVHLIGWHGDLYDQQLECSLLEFIRPEQKFDDISDLKEQIARDVLKCK